RAADNRRAPRRRTRRTDSASRFARAGAAHVEAELQLALRPILVDRVAHVAERLGHVLHSDPGLDLRQDQQATDRVLHERSAAVEDEAGLADLDVDVTQTHLLELVGN